MLVKNRAALKCKLCGKEFRGGSQETSDNCMKHLEEEHKDYFMKYEAERELFMKRLSVFQTQLLSELKIYASGLLGVFDKLEMKSKKWKCPDCGQEMFYGPHGRDFHLANRDKFCKKEEVK